MQHLVLLLLVLAALQPVPIPSITPSIQAPIAKLSVENASLTVYVYPDGTVSLNYTTLANILIERGLIQAPYVSIRALDEANETFRLQELKASIEIPLATAIAVVEREVRVSASQDARIGPGADIKGSIVIEYVGRTVSINYSILMSSYGATSVAVDAIAMGVENATRACKALCASLERLELEPWIESVECTCDGGKAHAELTASLVKALVATGFKPSEVDEVLKALAERLNATEAGRLEAKIASRDGSVVVELEYVVETRGPIEKLLSLSRVLNKLTLVLESRLAARIAGRMPTVVPPASLVKTPMLVEKPPYKSELIVETMREDGKLVLTVSYVSPRLSYARSIGKPEIDAMKALDELSETFRQLRINLNLLESLVEGASDLLPPVARVKGINGVKVEPSEVPPWRLNSVRVVIEEEAAQKPGAERHTGRQQSGRVETPKSTTTMRTPAEEGAVGGASAAVTTTPVTAPKTPTTAVGGRGVESMMLVGVALVLIALGVIVAFLRARG